jgi:hypothetical protein
MFKITVSGRLCRVVFWPMRTDVSEKSTALHVEGVGLFKSWIWNRQVPPKNCYSSVKLSDVWNLIILWDFTCDISYVERAEDNVWIYELIKKNWIMKSLICEIWHFQVIMRITAFWNVTLCILLEIPRPFRESCCLHLQGRIPFVCSEDEQYLTVHKTLIFKISVTFTLQPVLLGLAK